MTAKVKVLSRDYMRDETPENMPDLARGGRPPRAAGNSDAPGVPVVLSLAALLRRAGGSCRQSSCSCAAKQLAKQLADP